MRWIDEITRPISDLLIEAQNQFYEIDGSYGCEKAQGRYEGVVNAFIDYERSGTIRDIAWMRDACDSYCCKVRYYSNAEDLLDTLHELCSLISVTGVKVEQSGYNSDTTWETAIQYEISSLLESACDEFKEMKRPRRKELRELYDDLKRRFKNFDMNSSDINDIEFMYESCKRLRDAGYMSGKKLLDILGDVVNRLKT